MRNPTKYADRVPFFATWISLAAALAVLSHERGLSDGIDVSATSDTLPARVVLGDSGSFLRGFEAGAAFCREANP